MNNAIAMRGFIAVVLLVLAGMQLQQGHLLNAAVDAVFAVVAAILAFTARPGVRRPPTLVIGGLMAVGLVLWVASLVNR